MGIWHSQLSHITINILSPPPPTTLNSPQKSGRKRKKTCQCLQINQKYCCREAQTPESGLQQNQKQGENAMKINSLEPHGCVMTLIFSKSIVSLITPKAIIGHKFEKEDR
jgi:hypothetical protein